MKNLPAMRETRVRSLGKEDALEEGTAIHSSILAWRIPWTEEPGGLQSMGTEMTMHSSILAWRIPRTEEPGGATVHGDGNDNAL